MYEAPLTQVDLIPTLLVSKQLRTETRTAISNLPTRHSYTMDVMIVNETQLWPTWLSLPQLTRNVDKVHVTFRTVSVPRRPKLNYTGFRGGDGGPPLITWCFYDLLIRFLEVGPVGKRQAHSI